MRCSGPRGAWIDANVASSRQGKVITFMLTSSHSRLALLCGLAPFLGCAAATAEPSKTDPSAEATPAPESTGTTHEALTTSYYEWDQYLGHVTVMWPVSQGMCFLTGVGGDFQGTGENVHIELDNGYWVLTGSSMQNSVTGWAVCQAWADLGGYGYGTQEWFAEAYGGNGCGIGACGSTYWPGSATLWNGVNFCSLSYISGNFDANSWMETWWDGSNWRLDDSESAVQSYMWSGATCMGLKLSHNMASTAQYNWRAGQAPVPMLPVSQGVCALTEVQGGFRGGGEKVEILNLGGTWYLWGTSQQPNTGAGARCVYLHQY
jgi:hypothetical protein